MLTLISVYAGILAVSSLVMARELRVAVLVE